jgi:hypothetical protein
MIPEVVFEEDGGLVVFEHSEHTGQLHVELTTT